MQEKNMKKLNIDEQMNISLYQGLTKNSQY